MADRTELNGGAKSHALFIGWAAQNLSAFIN